MSSHHMTESADTLRDSDGSVRRAGSGLFPRITRSTYTALETPWSMRRPAFPESDDLLKQIALQVLCSRKA